MSTKAKPSPRERLLETAAALVCREGVGVGVEALCTTAGVSKRSMYQLFDSKDELLAAGLERRAVPYLSQLVPTAEEPSTPRARILYVFERLEERALSPGDGGCPYLAVQVELKDTDNPVSKVARGVKQDLQAFFRNEAVRGEVRDPDLLARQLMMVFDGASARAGIRVDDLNGLATMTVATLLDAAGAR